VGDRPRGDEQEIRRFGNGGQAREWGLVLSAAGIPSSVLRDSGGFALHVASADVHRAEAELAAYAEDVATRDAALARRRRSRPPEAVGSAPLSVALLTTLAMVGFYNWTGPARAGAAWFAHGSADVAAMRAGELWRAVTALCLHADLAHLTANALFGSFFLAAAGRSLGAGLALALVTLAGAGGNAVNAFLRSSDYVSLGASTAVFGAVGLLSGLGVVRRVQRGDRWRLTLLPFAGGLGILAMVGSGGGRVDVFAHLFGLLVGVLLGLATALAIARPPGPLAQAGWGAAAVLLLLGSWQLAL
jgi:membrane associated rhomboid family serine protease